MKALLSTAAAAVFAIGTAASAATLSIVGGTPGSIPGMTEPNLVLDRIFGSGASMDGFYGASIEASGVTAGETVLVEYLGVEAGFTNTFTMNGSDLFVKSGYESVRDTVSNLGSAVVSLGGNGLLDFSFTTSNKTQTVANGDANLQSDPVNFFAANGADGSIWLFFDDDGSNQDDNHDDLVIRISAVPLPAGALLLLTGVGALALRRRKA